MRSISRVMLVIGVAMLMVVDASAQQRQRGQGRGGRGAFGFGGLAGLIRNEGVQKELKLSSDQAEKATEAVQKVGEKYREQGAGLQDLSREERAEKRASLNKAMTSEQEKALEGILTPDQIKRLKQIELQNRYARAFTDPEVESKLKLTADQKEKIKTIASDAQAEMREIRQEARGNFAEIGKKMAALNKSTMDKIIAVLNPSQRETWKEMTGEPFTVQFQGRGRRGGGQ
jgi:hypothetical protein